MNARQLRETLSVFDAAALTTLTSKGLVRRAQRDIEAGRVHFTDIVDGKAVLLADGEQVQLGADGPGTASCSCPAQSICRHKIAALMFFTAMQESRSQAATSDSVSESHTRTDAPSSVADPLNELLDLPLSSVNKWAGKAKLLAAEEIVNDHARPEIVAQGAALVVRFSDDLPEVRYLCGQGLDGMVSKATAAKRKALHAAAVLAVRRRYRPGETPPQGDAAQALVLHAPDPGFLDQVLQCLSDCIRTGFNQAPLVLEERLFSLSVSSRADALPRLSKLLRALAACVRAKRERDFTLDPPSYLTLAAETYALTRALAMHAQADGEDPERDLALKGVVRKGYSAVGKLTVYGCGAHVWYSAGGARGVTAYFYAPERQRWYTASLARGNQHDTRFDPVQAYRRESLWSVGCLSDIANKKLSFENAAASDDGRLSLAGDIVATGESWAPKASAIGPWSMVFDDWSQLQSDLQHRFKPRLGAPYPSPVPVCLAAKRMAITYFDEHSQQTHWPLQDRDGRWIALSRDHHPDRESFTRALERASRAEKHWAVMALARPGRDSFTLEPYALCFDNGEHSIISLGLDMHSPTPSARAWTGKLFRTIGREAASAMKLMPGQFLPLSGNDATDALLDQTLDGLLAVAELGGIGTAISNADNIASLARRLDDVGLTPLAKAAQATAQSSPQDIGARLLQTAYLASLTRALIMPLPYLKVS